MEMVVVFVLYVAVVVALATWSNHHDAAWTRENWGSDEAPR